MDPNVIFLKALNVDSAQGIVVKARISRHLYAIKFVSRYQLPQCIILTAHSSPPLKRISTPGISTDTKGHEAAWV